MAITWEVVSVNPHKKEVTEYAHVLTDQITVADGEWLDMSTTEWLLIDAQGIITGDIVQVRGSNEATKPTAPTDERQVGADITAVGFRSIEKHAMPRWIKIETTAIAGGGTMNVWVKRVRNLQ